ncbi:hypothetical protein L1887_38337 [Cichorium endivia]|nr:hypothetical protein L1887_38337 [Cichorium endivia]
MAEVVGSLQALLELQQRHDSSVEPSGITGFTWKIQKYLVSATKKKDDQSGTSSSMSLENQCSSTSKDDSNHGERPRQHGESVATDLKYFTYPELYCATRNFEDGSYMTKSRGWINKTTYSPSEDNTGLPIVVKRIDLHKPAYQLELKEFCHPNLEKLIGYCLVGKPATEGFLVYEFMPTKSFSNLLHDKVLSRLPLVKKVKIAVGMARAIVYLNNIQDGTLMISHSSLDRHNILLDEDFTAKLSGYDITKLERGYYPRTIPPSKHLESGDYAPWVGISELQTDLSGFIVLFAEVLTGKHMSDEDEFQKIDDLFIQHGKFSLVDIAKSCFEICNEVDSESMMLRILEETRIRLCVFLVGEFMHNWSCISTTASGSSNTNTSSLSDASACT